MPITKSMVNEINAVLKDLGCSFTLRYVVTNSLGMEVNISPISNKFIQTVEFNLEEDFYIYLENFFSSKGVKLDYNNTKSCFWEAKTLCNK